MSNSNQNPFKNVIDAYYEEKKKKSYEILAKDYVNNVKKSIKKKQEHLKLVQLAMKCMKASD